VDIKSYIEELFTYLDTFESKYAEFETQAFLQTYNGIYAVFQALRQQRDKAVDVDRYFLDKIQKSPLSSSDLRQLSIQILIAFFESEADIDGQSNKAYLYCRDLRPIKRDISFFEDHLIPLLFREGSLNNNFRLNAFFLGEIARYLNKFGRPIQENLSPEAFGALSDPAKFLELMRRRKVLGDEILADRGSLEFHLKRVDTFTKLGRLTKLNESYLTEWDYLRQTSFWATLKSSLGGLWGKFKGAFKSARYFRLVMTQRSAAYLFYGVIIMVFILLALYVPSKWQDYTQDRLEEFQKKASTTQSGSGK
jgi:hypothetical protein